MDNLENELELDPMNESFYFSGKHIKKKKQRIKIVPLVMLALALISLAIAYFVKDSKDRQESISMQFELPTITFNKRKDYHFVLSGVLEGKEEVFINAGLEYDIDPYLLVAISVHETGWGDSKIARTKNNICGCMNDYGAMKFDSIEDSIYYMASNLKSKYIDIGLTTIEAIQPKYAPINANNDKNNLNQYWAYNVNSIYNKLKG